MYVIIYVNHIYIIHIYALSHSLSLSLHHLSSLFVSSSAANQLLVFLHLVITHPFQVAVELSPPSLVRDISCWENRHVLDRVGWNSWCHSHWPCLKIYISAASTLWLCQNSYWKWPLIVDFPIKSMVIFNSYVKVPEGKWHFQISMCHWFWDVMAL